MHSYVKNVGARAFLATWSMLSWVPLVIRSGRSA
jgi:hypothetical protein